MVACVVGMLIDVSCRSYVREGGFALGAVSAWGILELFLWVWNLECLHSLGVVAEDGGSNNEVGDGIALVS